MPDKYFFSFRPRLKPKTIRPSEDHPSELILIASGSGAALGISCAEKRLVDLMDGARTIADIVKLCVKEEIANLADLRQLLWDLDRFGFLEESPWSLKWEPEGKGYWGGWDQPCSAFTCRPLLGPLEKWAGRIMISPIFAALSLLTLCYGIIEGWGVLASETPLIVNNSVALALLIVLVSLIGGCLLASWFASMTLRTVHPAPVRILADYRYGVPIFRLDARRLRAFSLKRSLLASLAPVFMLLFLSSAALIIAAHSQGIRREWLFHLAASWWLASFLLSAPWNSTVLSRDIVLRLRGESVFWIMTKAVRKALRSLSRNAQENLPHEKLLLGWGVWTLIGAFILIRLITIVFRFNLPILVNHFLQEEKPVVLATLFFLLALFAVAFLSAIAAFFIWLFREMLREIRNRYWPQRDHLIVSIFLAAAIFLSVQLVWNLSPRGLGIFVISSMIGGLFLAASGVFAWRREGGGFEPAIVLFVAFAGVLIVLFAACSPVVDISPSSDLSLEIPNEAVAPPLFFYFIQSLGLLVMAAFAVYLLDLYYLKFSSLQFSGSFLQRILIASILALLILISLIRWIPFNADAWGSGARIAAALVAAISIAGTAMRGSLRNHSTPLLTAAILIVFLGLYWNPQANASIAVRAALVLSGVLLALGGLSLRISSASKTALLLSEAENESPLIPDWDIPRLGEAFLAAAANFYNGKPAIAPSAELNEETARRFFADFNALGGAAAMRAITRRAIMTAPWSAARRLFTLLPVSVSVPHLTDWTKEKVEQWLTKVPSFANIGREIHQLSPRARIALFDPGDAMIVQNEPGRSIFVVVSGRISVEADHAFGRTILAILDSGAYVGEIGFLSGCNRTAAVRALESSLALLVSRQDIAPDLPKMSAALREAESGDYWLQRMDGAPVFREFSPSLNARVCIEARRLVLQDGESFRFGERYNEIAILLSGQAALVSNGQSEIVRQGALLGLEECLDNAPYQKWLRSDGLCQILILDRALFSESINNLLTPPQIFRAVEEDAIRLHGKEASG
ncbi:MAG: cyclic nucleotide-binding domain-containing protein [Candidatus Omnitrophota bacterium]